MSRQNQTEPPPVEDEPTDQSDALDERVGNQPVQPFERVEAVPEVERYRRLQTLPSGSGAFPRQPLAAPALLTVERSSASRLPRVDGPEHG